MPEHIGFWGGKERLFHLRLGEVLKLEEACGKVAIGSLFLRVSTGNFYVRDLTEIIRFGLVGGGETPVEAKRLVDTFFDQEPYLVTAELAARILEARVVGMEPDQEAAEGEPKPWKFSEVSQVCRHFHMSPQDLLEMDYAAFVNMMKGWNAAQKTTAEPPTEEEFEDILRRYEPEALKS